MTKEVVSDADYENENRRIYRFEVLDWEIKSRIAVAQRERGTYIQENLYESIDLIFSCVYTTTEIIRKAVVRLYSEPILEKQNELVTVETKSIGTLTTEAGKLTVLCGVPHHMLCAYLIAAAFGKIRHIYVIGTKLKSGRDRLYDLVLSTQWEALRHSWLFQEWSL